MSTGQTDGQTPEHRIMLSARRGQHNNTSTLKPAIQDNQNEPDTFWTTVYINVISTNEPEENVYLLTPL